MNHTEVFFSPYRVLNQFKKRIESLTQRTQHFPRNYVTPYIAQQNLNISISHSTWRILTLQRLQPLYTTDCLPSEHISHCHQVTNQAKINKSLAGKLNMGWIWKIAQTTSLASLHASQFNSFPEKVKTKQNRAKCKRSKI